MVSGRSSNACAVRNAGRKQRISKPFDAPRPGFWVYNSAMPMFAEHIGKMLQESLSELLTKKVCDPKGLSIFGGGVKQTFFFRIFGGFPFENDEKVKECEVFLDTNGNGSDNRRPDITGKK